METIEQKTERARLLAEYAAKGGTVTVCGADRRAPTTERALRLDEVTAPGVRIGYRELGVVVSTETFGVALLHPVQAPELYDALARAAAAVQTERGYRRDAWSAPRAKELYAPELDGVDAFTSSDSRPGLFVSLFDTRADDAWGRA